MSLSYRQSLSLYEKAVSELHDVRRKGKANPYTSHGGHMFSFLDKDARVSVRLGKEVLLKFMKDNNTTKSKQHGSEMREFALVPEVILIDTKLMTNLLKKSLEYVSSLKPK